MIGKPVLKKEKAYESSTKTRAKTPDEALIDLAKYLPVCYISMDKNGTWSVWERCPAMMSDGWFTPGHYAILAKGIVESDDDWRHSLRGF